MLDKELCCKTTHCFVTSVFPSPNCPILIRYLVILNACCLWNFFWVSLHDGKNLVNTNLQRFVGMWTALNKNRNLLTPIFVYLTGVWTTLAVQKSDERYRNIYEVSRVHRWTTRVHKGCEKDTRIKRLVCFVVLKSALVSLSFYWFSVIPLSSKIISFLEILYSLILPTCFCRSYV